MASKSYVAKAVTTLCQMYRIEQNEMMLNTWDIALEGVEDHEVNRGLKRTIQERESAFIPSPGEFRKLCTLDHGVGSVEESALLAWSDVVQSVRRVGNYQSLMIKDTVAAETIRRVYGGWVKICERLTEANTPFEEKRFVAVYKSLWRSKGNYSPLLIGTADGNPYNRALVENGKAGLELEFCGYESQEAEQEAAEQAHQEFIHGGALNVLAMAYKRRKQLEA